MISMEKFFNLMAHYNTTLWPMHILMYLLACGAVFLVFRKSDAGDRVVKGILAFYWLWSGLVLFIIFFGSLHFQYYFWGLLWIVQGFLFLHDGFLRKGVSFVFQGTWSNYLGIFFVLFAMILYPIIGHMTGHPYPAGPQFGVAPCPVAIFTCGLYLLTDKNRKFPMTLVIIPFFWSLMGFFAAFKMGIYVDNVEAMAGMLALSIIIFRNRSLQKGSISINIK